MTKAELESEVERCHVIMRSDAAKILKLQEENKVLRFDYRDLSIAHDVCTRDNDALRQERDSISAEASRLRDEVADLVSRHNDSYIESIAFAVKADAFEAVIDKFIGGEK